MKENKNQDSPKRVIGLAYKPEQGLPKVILKGSAKLADNIIAEAKKLKNSTPVVHDKKLLEALYQLPTDAEIGKDLFELVATLLVHVYAIDAKMKEDAI